MINFLKKLLITGILTLFTQIGGIIYLLCLPIFYRFKKLNYNIWKRRFFNSLVFIFIYLMATFFIVPPLAKKQCGRVPLPIFSHPNLKPHNAFYYCLLNHHYVRPELKTATENVADKLAKKYPGTILCYLDANFPFINGYPLEPHFSHRDGKKIDVSLHWKMVKTHKPIFGNPSLLGYGAYADPITGERNVIKECQKKGNWPWYRDLEEIGVGKFFNKNNYELDQERTREMIRLFATEKTIGKILLEPHLKTRLKLGKYGKIRFQGCKAARHDDHIHVQL